jgi:hypothetical protein
MRPDSPKHMPLFQKEETPGAADWARVIHPHTAKYEFGPRRTKISEKRNEDGGRPCFLFLTLLP